MDGGAALSSVVRTLLALVGVCALAWVALALIARRGGLAARLAGSVGSRSPARVRVLERVALSPRRQLYLVQADARVFLLGAGDAGALALIAELPDASPVSALANASVGPPPSASDRARAAG